MPNLTCAATQAAHTQSEDSHHCSPRTLGIFGPASRPGSIPSLPPLTSNRLQRKHGPRPPERAQRHKQRVNIPQNRPFPPRPPRPSRACGCRDRCCPRDTAVAWPRGRVEESGKSDGACMMMPSQYEACLRQIDQAAERTPHACSTALVPAAAQACDKVVFEIDLLSWAGTSPVQASGRLHDPRSTFSSADPRTLSW